MDPVTGARAPCCVWAVRRPQPKARSLTVPRRLSTSLSPPQLERTRAVHVTSRPTNKRQAPEGAWPAGGLNPRSLFMRHTHPRARLRGELGVFKASTNILTFPDMPMLPWHIRVTWGVLQARLHAPLRRSEKMSRSHRFSPTSSKAESFCKLISVEKVGARRQNRAEQQSSPPLIHRKRESVFFFRLQHVASRRTIAVPAHVDRARGDRACRSRAFLQLAPRTPVAPPTTTGDWLRGNVPAHSASPLHATAA